jgi:NAD(P)-dependent dehydrogenase (short-subunit alcohol dehydrogenase family)
MKKALITGVSKGIGRSISELFLEKGYCVFGTYFNDYSMAKELIDKYGNEKVVLFGPYDFTCRDDIFCFLQNVKRNTFDSVIFNAGIFSENDDFNSFDLADFEKVMNCNFYTPLILSTGLKNSIKSGGSIVIVSSNDAYPGAYSSMSYSISKSSLLSLMKCLSVNYGLYDIRVNSIAPGAIDTDMNTPEQMNIAPYFTPISRAGNTKDVAKVVYFLASDESSFISGENITVDGGYSIVSILLKSEADSELSKNLQDFIKNHSD